MKTRILGRDRDYDQELRLQIELVKFQECIRQRGLKVVVLIGLIAPPLPAGSRPSNAEYSRAKDEMFALTDIKQAPWHVVNAENKTCARVNVIRHLLSLADSLSGPHARASQTPSVR